MEKPQQEIFPGPSELAETSKCKPLLELVARSAYIRYNYIDNSHTDTEKRVSQNESMNFTYADMQANFELLTNMPESRADYGVPVMTVCVPYAILAEDQEQVAKRLFNGLATAQQELDQPIELVVWANATDKADPNEAASNYEKLRHTLATFESSNLQIKTALQILPEDEASISRLRANYMDAVSIMAAKRGYDHDHPVLWLDADTTYIAPATLQQINKAVRSNKSLLVHANERYTTEWADGVPLSGRDDATKAITINELHRRRYTNKSTSGIEREYHEESGLAFSISTYLQLGGINTRNPINEAGSLYGYAVSLLDTGTVDHISNRRRGRHSNVRPGDPRIITYVPEARIGLSARRLLAPTRAYGTVGINYDRYQQDYYLHSTMSIGEAKKIGKTVTRAAMRKFLKGKDNDYKLVSNSDIKLNSAQKRLVNSLVDRSFIQTDPAETEDKTIDFEDEWAARKQARTRATS